MRTTPQIIRDRRAEIATAIETSESEDVVLVAGKGHEDYQQIGDQRFTYSDREVVRELLGEAA
jgi:UDP-N-acetylmuramoyl-L-alanyl-D-glutamate--2,6-diaminopimelate ligase